MLGKVGSYMIAFVVLAGVELPFLPIALVLSPALRKAKWVSPFLVGLLDTVKTCLAIVFAVWLINKIGQSSTWLMFLIPGCLMVRNDIMRVDRVKAGQSNVKRLLEHNGEPESYDQKHDLWIERAHLTGDIAGWIIGVNLVLQSAGFF